MTDVKNGNRRRLKYSSLFFFFFFFWATPEKLNTMEKWGALVSLVLVSLLPLSASLLCASLPLCSGTLVYLGHCTDGLG